MLRRNSLAGLTWLGCAALAACGGRTELNDYRDGVGIPTSSDIDEATDPDDSADETPGGDDDSDTDEQSATGDGDGDNAGDGDADDNDDEGAGDGDSGDGDSGDGDSGDGDTDPGDGDTDPGDGDSGDGDTDPGDGDTDPGDGDADGPAQPGEVGGSCEEASDCLDGEGQCLTTVGGGRFSLEFPGGYCVQPGCESDEDCPSGASCLSSPLLEMQGVPPACVAGCEGNGDCRDGYECGELPFGGDGTTYCLPPLPGGFPF